MTPVEALANGKPVIALGRGGALEVVPSFGGVFYEDASQEGLSGAVKRLETLEPHGGRLSYSSPRRVLPKPSFSKR
jgi:hypothetical protein